MEFEGKILIIGNSYGVTLPAQFVNQGALNQGQAYEFETSEVDSSE